MKIESLDKNFAVSNINGKMIFVGLIPANLLLKFTDL